MAEKCSFVWQCPAACCSTVSWLCMITSHVRHRHKIAVAFIVQSTKLALVSRRNRVGVCVVR